MKVKRIAGFELVLFILPLPLYCGGRMRKISVETSADIKARMKKLKIRADESSRVEKVL